MSTESIKSAAGMIGGVILVGIIIAIPIMLLMGIAEVSVWMLDWIPSAIGWATLIGILLVPLAIIPPSRGFAGSLFTLVSSVYLIAMWFYAMAFTYLEWGLVGLVVGVLLFGVGVLFTGTLAAVVAGAWTVLGNLAMLLAFYIVARLVGAWLSENASKRRIDRALRETPGAMTISQNVDENQSR